MSYAPHGGLHFLPILEPTGPLGPETSIFSPFSEPPGPPGPGTSRAQRCASAARNPKGPQITPFCTNRVAIQPFWTSEAGFDAEFRRRSRQIGPTPSMSTFVDHILPQMLVFFTQQLFFDHVFDTVFGNFKFFHQIFAPRTPKWDGTTPLAYASVRADTL